MGDQNSISLRVDRDVTWVGAPIFKAVMRVDLNPLLLGRGAVVDIVPKGLLFTAAQIRLLQLESWIVPIILKRKRFLDLHREDEKAGALGVGRTGSHYPVTRL